MNTVVTGGSRGIGRAIVHKFVKEGYGCAFTYAGNEEAALETVKMAQAIRPGAVIKSYKMDVKNSREVEEQMERIIEDFDNIDSVVNNAGIVRDNAAVLMSDEEWEEVITTNLSGPFFVIRSLLMHFISNRKGRIINISSLAQHGSSGQVNYAASKAGLIGLTQTLAREYGPKGITSNIVAVGYVETDMVKNNLAEPLRKIWFDYCPLKRVGSADEIASLVYYLTTEDAGFINGEVIHVSGGLTYIP
ncbi:MAG: SDR family oxidoreductase [Spirochaetota bacterium]